MEISADLASALEDYESFLIADDFERDAVIRGADASTLHMLVATVEPLFDEINATLDRLSAAAHPLPDRDEDLEVSLNSLAQAAIEASLEATSR